MATKRNPVKDLYLTREAHALLGVDEKTLRAWMKLAQLETTPSAIDKRIRYVTHADLEKLAQLHGKKISASRAIQVRKADATRTRDEELRALVKSEVERLIGAQSLTHQTRYEGQETALTVETTYEPLSMSEPVQRPARPLSEAVIAHVPSVRSRPWVPQAQSHSTRWSDRLRTTDYPKWTSESGYIPLTDFLEQHGIAVSTANKHRTKHVFTTERFLIGRNAGAHAIDQENALLELLHCRARGLLNPDSIGHCGISNCPCSMLLPAPSVGVDDIV